MSSGRHELNYCYIEVEAARFCHWLRSRMATINNHNAKQCTSAAAVHPQPGDTELASILHAATPEQMI